MRNPLLIMPMATLALTVLVAALSAKPAHASQDLKSFLRAAKTYHPDTHENVANTQGREAEVDLAKARLLPTLAVNGLYTRNQYEVALGVPGANGAPGKKVTIQPYNQFDANATLAVPIVDFAAWERIDAAQANARQTRTGERIGELDLQRKVTRAYFQCIAQDSVVQASQRNRQLALQNREVVVTKMEAGLASELELARANAEIARSDQALAQAEFAALQSRRELKSLTGIEPAAVLESPKVESDAAANDREDRPELLPVDAWLEQSRAHPGLVRAQSQVDFAAQNVQIAKLNWVPTLALNVQERITNATGFAGRWNYFSAQAVLAWRGDLSGLANRRVQEASHRGALARLERTRLATNDTVYLAWHQIDTGKATAHAARTQVESTRLATRLAQDRYASGIATQLDLLAAQQDLFRAEVMLIQADAELAYARAALRLASGESLLKGDQP